MKQRTPVYINIFWILVILLVVYYMFVQDSSFLSSPYFWGTVVISSIMAMIHNSIGDLIENAQFKKLSAEEKTAYLEEKKIPYFKRIWGSAVKKQDTKEEKDILIDHGFDGIMELDNQLPKWWLGLFYFGVAYCIVYITSFFTTNFAHPDEEYNVEHKDQIASIQKYMEETPPPTIDNAVYSADNIEAGKEVFNTNCASCHMENGKGGIGPNLTDDNWINHPEKTLFKNVFYMVQNGSENNPTMRAFGKNGELTGFDIQNVAAYIYHINQEQPPITVDEGGAAPQGDAVTWEDGK